MSGSEAWESGGSVSHATDQAEGPAVLPSPAYPQLMGWIGGALPLPSVPRFELSLDWSMWASLALWPLWG